MHHVLTTASSHHVWLIDLVRRFGYLALFGIIAVQDLGVPTLIPGTLVLLFAGYLASIHALNPVVCVLVATVASVIGSSGLFQIARVGGGALVHRYARFMQLDRDSLARLERGLWRWGLPMWVILRMIPGLRGALTIIAGLGGLSYRRFLFLTGVSGIVWAFTSVVAGMLLGRHWGRAGRVFGVTGPVTILVIVAVVVAVVVVPRLLARTSWPVGQQMALVVKPWRWNLGDRAWMPQRSLAVGRQVKTWGRDLAGRVRNAHYVSAASAHLKAWRHGFAGRVRVVRERGRRVSDAGTDPGR